jgi:hypothetical protein
MEDGYVFPNCCPDWVEFPLGNLHEQTWDEVWNGENAQKMRQSMLDGSARHCDGDWCPHLQNAAAGVDDPNVVSHDRRGELGLDLDLDGGEAAVTCSSGPSTVGMHYESSCNLACPTCRGGIEVLSGAALDRMKSLHEVVVGEMLPDATAISLTGSGDPFASKFLRDFLISFDPADHPKIEKVHLSTNATMWTPAVWARMTGLHEVEISTDISIDAACAETYHVVRAPGRWDRLFENLEFITTIPNLSSMGISMTVSQLNHREVLAFYELGRSLAERCPDVWFFVEYKRVRRRWHHSDESWAALALEHLPRGELAELQAQLVQLDRLRATGPARPQIRTNLGELSHWSGKEELVAPEDRFRPAPGDPDQALEDPGQPLDEPVQGI